MTRQWQDVEYRGGQSALADVGESVAIAAPARVPTPTAEPAPVRRTDEPARTTGQGRYWQRRYGRRLIVTDALIVCLVMSASHLMWLGERSQLVGPSLRLPYVYITMALSVLWVISLSMANSRDSRITGAGGDEYKRVIDGTMRLFGTVAIIFFLVGANAGHSYFFFALPMGVVLLIAGRWLSRKWLVAQRRAGRHTTRAVLVGDWDATEHVIRQLAQDSAAGLVLVGAVTQPFAHPRRALSSGVRVLGSYDDLLEGIRRCGVDAVIYTGAGELGPRRLRELGWQLDDMGVDLIVAPALTDIAGPRIHARPVAGVPLVRVDYPRFEGGRRIAKRALDVVGSSLALLLLAPFFVLLAVLIRLDSTGPAVFRQTRVGLKGKTFRMLKFRSMVADAESRLAALVNQSDGNGVQFKMREDPRVTRVGRPLRKYSLDELPQLVNVLRGEMSLVGPRPPLACEVEHYDEWAHRRFLVKPGLTGHWQIKGRSDLCWDDCVRWDLYYVENWSLMGDLLILWKTLRVLVRPTGAY